MKSILLIFAISANAASAMASYTPPGVTVCLQQRLCEAPPWPFGGDPTCGEWVTSYVCGQQCEAVPYQSGPNSPVETRVTCLAPAT